MFYQHCTRSITKFNYGIEVDYKSFCLLFAYANCRLCRAVQILITTSCSTYVKLFERGLNESFIASVFCDQELDGQG